MLKEMLLADKKITDIPNYKKRANVTVPSDATTGQILELFAANPESNSLQVVDRENRLIGIIEISLMTEYLFPITTVVEKSNDFLSFKNLLFNGRTAEEIMNNEPGFVTEENSLAEAAKTIVNNKITEIPVIDDKGKLTGELRLNDISDFYIKLSKKDR